MTYEERLEEFKQRTMFVEDILDSHPDMSPVSDREFTEDERSVFTKYFLVDWDKYSGDYRDVWRLLSADEDETALAEKAYLKFRSVNRIP